MGLSKLNSTITHTQITANAVYAGDFQCSEDEKIVRCTGIVVEDVVLNVSRGGCTLGKGIEMKGVGKVVPESCGGGWEEDVNDAS